MNSTSACIAEIVDCSQNEKFCDVNADCLLLEFGTKLEHFCRCKIGWAGNGLHCGVDSDSDGWPDQPLNCTDLHCSRDNCVDLPNAGQEDADNDKIGDVCDKDSDGDSVLNLKDNCPFVFNDRQKDSDRDGIGDACDNCPMLENRQQLDNDNDGLGNECDEDIDNDGIPNKMDNCPLHPNSDQLDLDKDGIGDECDNCPNISNPLQEDHDADRLGNACDSEIDGDSDGIQDSEDNCPMVCNPDQLDTDQDAK